MFNLNRFLGLFTDWIEARPMIYVDTKYARRLNDQNDIM